MALEAGKMHGFTDPRRWAYSYELDLPKDNRGEGAAEFCFLMQVKTGSVGLLALSKDEPALPLGEVDIKPKSAPVDRCLKVDLKKTSKLLIRNHSSAGQSEFLLERITLWQP